MRSFFHDSCTNRSQLAGMCAASTKSLKHVEALRIGIVDSGRFSRTLHIWVAAFGKTGATERVSSCSNRFRTDHHAASYEARIATTAGQWISIDARDRRAISSRPRRISSRATSICHRRNAAARTILPKDSLFACRAALRQDGVESAAKGGDRWILPLCRPVPRFLVGACAGIRRSASNNLMPASGSRSPRSPGSYANARRMVAPPQQRRRPSGASRTSR